MAFKLKDEMRGKMTAVAGILGTILAAIGILDHFQLFLTLLSNLIIPIAGVMIADYWIIHKGKKEGFMEKEPSQNIALIAYSIGAILGVISTFQPDFVSQTPALANSLPVLSIIFPLIIYVILEKNKRGKNYEKA